MRPLGRVVNLQALLAWVDAERIRPERFGELTYDELRPVLIAGDWTVAKVDDMQLLGINTGVHAVWRGRGVGTFADGDGLLAGAGRCRGEEGKGSQSVTYLHATPYNAGANSAGTHQPARGPMRRGAAPPRGTVGGITLGIDECCGESGGEPRTRVSPGRRGRKAWGVHELHPPCVSHVGWHLRGALCVLFPAMCDRKERCLDRF